MKQGIVILSTAFILFSCKRNLSQHSANRIGEEGNSIHKAGTYSYDSMLVPEFFKKITENHQRDFMLLDNSEYIEFCSAHGLNSNDSANASRFFTVKIIHELFTSQTASNYSRGDILNIPYLWHWVQPNPRHQIELAGTNRLLKDIKPPKEFSKYSTYADIDRTPYLFLSELFNAEPKYYSASSDTFSTFGWCSEREMAFVCLMELLNYNGKVVAEGNHSWSEFLIPMVNLDTGLKKFKVKVDNTFDSAEWEEMSTGSIENWKKYKGNSPMANWYNQTALAHNEKQRVKDFIASPKAMKRIENSLVNYLNEKMNAD